MADTTISPNMNLPVPVPSVCPGPAWATDAVGCFYGVDSHNHSVGQGVQIGPDGMNINAALPMNENNLTRANSVGFTALNAALTALLDSLQVVGVDLYFIDGNGNSVRITQGGTVTGATGTITGLPSGTASASFAGGTFTWRSATNVPATMNVGPIVSGAQVANSKTVTIGAASTQPANYAMVWPQAQGAASSIMSNDGAGNLAWSPVTTIISASGLLSIVADNDLAVAVPASTSTDISSISLTAGTWLISGGIYGFGASGSLLTAWINTISLSSFGTTTGLNYFASQYAGAGGSVAIPGFTVVVASTTVYYLTAFCNAASTVSGSIRGIRIA